MNEENNTLRCSSYLLVNKLHETGRQLVKHTEKVMENNRIVTAPMNTKVDTIWASKCCTVEILRY